MSFSWRYLYILQIMDQGNRVEWDDKAGLEFLTLTWHLWWIFCILYMEHSLAAGSYTLHICPISQIMGQGTRIEWVAVAGLKFLA